MPLKVGYNKVLAKGLINFLGRAVFVVLPYLGGQCLLHNFHTKGKQILHADVKLDCK